MTHYGRGLDHSTASPPPPLHPTCPHVILSLSIPLSLSYSHPFNPYRKFPTPPYQLEPITGLPCQHGKERRPPQLKSVCRRDWESWMRNLKVLLSHPCPYPLCQSVESPRRNVQPPKDLGMKISQGRDSWSHLFTSTSASNYIITSP